MKKFFGVLLSACLLFSLVACGGDSGSAASTAEPAGDAASTAFNTPSGDSPDVADEKDALPT